MQINITTVPFSDFSESSDNVFPEIVSGKEKLGAIVPRGIMFEGVSAMVSPFKVCFTNNLDEEQNCVLKQFSNLKQVFVLQ